MISATDGWIVDAEGSLFHWQEDTLGFPIGYAIIMGASVVVAAVSFFLARRKPKLEKSTKA
jgi:ABC-type multidrug transport system permease subunit